MATLVDIPDGVTASPWARALPGAESQTQHEEARAMALSDSLEKLYAAAAEIARQGPCANQVAVAQGGSVVGFRAFGRARFGAGVSDASQRSLFVQFSVTKAIVSSAAWILLQEGQLSLSDRVTQFIPGFGSGLGEGTSGSGKDLVTLEQLLTHTAGFPSARMDPRDWLDPELRRARFIAWPLEWEPGSRFTYHGVSTMWLLAEIITQRTGSDYRDFIRTRIFEPLRLANLFIGLPDSEQSRVAELVALGEPMTDEEQAASPVDAPGVGEDLLTEGNESEIRSAGSPAGGAVGTAADLALFYQGLLADYAGTGAGIWDRNMLEDAFTPRNVDLIDPMTKQPALRGLGVVIAGEQGRIWRGFADECSPASFGHMGAGGQIAWADPESGVSFAYCTNGADHNPARQGAHGLHLSSLAAALA